DLHRAPRYRRAERCPPACAERVTNRGRRGLWLRQLRRRAPAMEETMVPAQSLHLETAAPSRPPQPGRPEITAEAVARSGAWARAHDRTFSELVCEWIGRGGLRALARQLDR